MSETTIFTRTSLGDAVLDNGSGRISGDDRRLMLLIDGKANADEISGKIPPSVRASLDEAFERLLSAGFIVETGEADMPGKSLEQNFEGRDQKVVQTSQDTEESGLDLEQYIELEKELAGARAQVVARSAQIIDASDRYERSLKKITVCVQSIQAKLAEKMAAMQGSAENDLRASFENGLRELGDGLGKLNRMLIEQQENIETTLKLNAFKAEDNAKQQKYSEAEAAKMARSHPHFNALLGLDFFKAFGNTELLHFLQIAKFQEVKAGDTVLREGDVGMSFFIIVSGSLNVLKQDKFLASVERGDFFGEFSHLSGEQPLRSAAVVAVTDCSLLVIEPLDIEFASVQMRLNVAEAFLRGLVRRSLISNQRMSGLLGHMYSSKS